MRIQLVAELSDPYMGRPQHQRDGVNTSNELYSPLARVHPLDLPPQWFHESCWSGFAAQGPAAGIQEQNFQSLLLAE